MNRSKTSNLTEKREFVLVESQTTATDLVDIMNNYISSFLSLTFLKYNFSLLPLKTPLTCNTSRFIFYKDKTSHTTFSAIIPHI